MTEEQKGLLNKPSGLAGVILPSNRLKSLFRVVDFTGTTVEEAIKKVLAFYKHKTYRKLVGSLTFKGITKHDEALLT